MHTRHLPTSVVGRAELVTIDVGECTSMRTRTAAREFANHGSVAFRCEKAEGWRTNTSVCISRFRDVTRDAHDVRKALYYETEGETGMRACLFSRVVLACVATVYLCANSGVSAREGCALSFRPSPYRAFVRQNTNYLHCEITPRVVADARRCIIPRAAIAYKRNLRLMQRVLFLSLSLLSSLSFSVLLLHSVSSLQPRLDRSLVVSFSPCAPCLS